MNIQNTMNYKRSSNITIIILNYGPNVLVFPILIKSFSHELSAKSVINIVKIN